MLWTFVKIWAIINLLGIAIVSAIAIYKDITEGEDDETDL
jgi:hypothetical protein